MELRADGTGSIQGTEEPGGPVESADFTWDEHVLRAEGEEVPYVYEDGTLTIAAEDAELVFTKTD